MDADASSSSWQEGASSNQGGSRLYVYFLFPLVAKGVPTFRLELDEQ